MMTPTYASPDVEPDAVRRALAKAGFELDAPVATRRVLLDTFDGRLHDAGLRLEHHTVAGKSRLVLVGTGTAPAHATATGLPTSASDVPAGPLRARLAPLLEMRVLLPTLTIDSVSTVASQRDRTGKLVTSVAIDEQLHANSTQLATPHWLGKIEPLLGYEKAAQRADALLEGLGLQKLDEDLVTLAAQAAGVDLRGTSISPTVRLDPALPAFDAYRSVLANLALAIDVNWQGTVDDVDSEFLHDLRVAVRRTRSVLAQAKRVLPPDVRDQRRADFKWLGDLTSPARDLDVYVLEWDSYVAPLGDGARRALRPVLARLEKRRRTEHVALAKQLKGARARTLLSSWREWLSEPPADQLDLKDAARPIGRIAAARIIDAQRQLVDRGRGITPVTPAQELHELRKDAKKLRYLLECFGGLYETAPRKAFVGRLKALQDNLGEHQDAEVHVAQLQELAAELDGARGVGTPTILAMGQLTEHLDQRRRAAREEFAQRFAAYDTRPTRDALSTLLASTKQAKG
jgi:CHAD domain-containing protein